MEYRSEWLQKCKVEIYTKHNSHGSVIEALAYSYMLIELNVKYALSNALGLLLTKSDVLD